MPFGDHWERLGAHVSGDAVTFGVWAPKANNVAVRTESGGHRNDITMERGPSGIYSARVEAIGAGARYGFVVDGQGPFPDLRARFQPDGVHGLSQVVDPSTYDWSDEGWQGLTRDGLSLYELHVGAYTRAGTFRGLIDELPEIAQLGVRAIELMPVNAFPGRWGWGYDGVGWFAPHATYGKPDDLRALIDAAHAQGLGVVLDVVYNHFGPDGNYARVYSDDYFTDRHMTPWGEGINFDGPESAQVRALVFDNIRMWIEEYHIDGFRLDAADYISDDSCPHLLAELSERTEGFGSRSVLVIAEDSSNDVDMIHSRTEGGNELDAVWTDDFHHELHVYLTGAQENYFESFEGRLLNVAKIVNEGFYYQGQVYPTWGRERGKPIADEPASGFVFCIQNHDQVGNRPFAERLHHQIDRERYLVASALLLFCPQTPLLFMGQEFAASSPFPYFSDHNEELGRLVTEGRRQEFQGFRAFGDETMREFIPDPQAESTFLAAKLPLGEREHNAGVLALYRDMLHLRATDPVLSVNDRACTRAAAIGPHLLLIHRWNGENHRLLIANFDHAVQVAIPTYTDLDLPDAAVWHTILSTGQPAYGGSDRVAEFMDGSTLACPARTATILEGADSPR